jgi:hypothetical protein
MTATDCPLIAIVDRELAAELAADLAAVGERFVAGVAALAPIAAELAQLDAELRAAEGRTGCRRRGPSPAQLAADVVCGNLRALRPHLPFVSEASAERAVDALLSRGEGR